MLNLAIGLLIGSVLPDGRSIIEANALTDEQGNFLTDEQGNPIFQEEPQ